MKKLNRTTTNLPSNKPTKILQFGGGNFLRAFTDWMIDELNNQTDFNAGVIIVKPTKNGDYTALRKQDGLFHIQTKGIKNGKLVADNQLITCVQQVIHPYLEWETFLKTAEISSLRFIVSNTTEAGIQFNKNDQKTAAPPKEFPAKLTLWLYHRWQYFQGRPESGCIHLPCELIEQNGEQLKSCILAYAELWQLNGGFIYWINQHNHFCNTLVDRIVPGFPKDTIQSVYESIGFEDELVAVAEPYHVWVIEAEKEIQAELPFAKTDLNVVFTNDLAPYRQLKVRILNGAHTTLVPYGYLEGIETVREAVEDEKVGNFLQKALFEEILPTLDFPQAILEQYANDVLDRFKNPFIHHQLISIALNCTSKFKVRVLPSLLAFHQQKGVLPENLVTAFAALLYFYKGKRGADNIPLKDNAEFLSFFKTIWQEWDDQVINTEQLVQTVLGKTDLWGQDLTKIDELPAALTKALYSRMNDA